MPSVSVSSSISAGDDDLDFTSRKVNGTRRKLGEPSIRLHKNEVKIKHCKMEGDFSYSGRDIFCKFEKKSLFKIVEAERILPERLITTCFTSSGSATPSDSSARSRGFNAWRPSARSSFSNVLMTRGQNQYSHAGIQEGKLPGRFLTNVSKDSKDLMVSGSVDCK